MRFGYNGLFGLIVLIADVYAIISVLGSSASTGKKVGWVLLVLLLPIIGFIFWYFAGPRGARSA
jgi:hypothetical protein